MTKTTESSRLICEGPGTRAAASALRAAGWRWDAARVAWVMRLVPAHAQRIVDGDEVFFRGLGGHRKGCQLTLDGRVVWTSKTYGEQPQSQHADQDGCGWNTDAAGNPVASERIPGSAPDDRI